MEIFRNLLNEEALTELFLNSSIWSLLAVVAFAILLLSKGADWLVDGAAGLAMRANIPKVIIGATIISLGTTAPEMFVSVTAAYMGDSSLALGNGVGSIITDTGLIFGLTVLIAAPKFQHWILNRTGWWQIGSALLMVALATAAKIEDPVNPVLGRGMGIILVLCLFLYLFMTFNWSKHSKAFESEENNKIILSIPVVMVAITGGLVLVIFSSRILVPAAGEVARRFGVSEDVIAATMVALGTSLPELSTAIAAIRRGQPEITVGNIVGADVLNSLFVVGAAALATPLIIPARFFNFHFPAMLIILLSFRIFSIFTRTKRWPRWQGTWLLLLYIAYILIQYV